MKNQLITLINSFLKNKIKLIKGLQIIDTVSFLKFTFIQNKLALWIGVCLLISFGCRQKIVTDVKLPPLETKLVLYAFISPEDSFIDAEVSLSRPVYGTLNNSDLYVMDAEVSITDLSNNQNVLIPYDFNVEKYRVSQALMKIIPGKTYLITAKYNTASKNYQVSGSTTIPLDLVNLTSVNVQAVTNQNKDGKEYLFSMQWQDIAGKKNYYRIHAESILYFDLFDSTANSIGDLMLNDENNEGKLISTQSQFSTYNFDSSAQESFCVYLLNTDNNYYEYHVRRLNYEGDNPFSEPLQQYSNVTGGLGLVSSFRKSFLRVK